MNVYEKRFDLICDCGCESQMSFIYFDGYLQMTFKQPLFYAYQKDALKSVKENISENSVVADLVTDKKTLFKLASFLKGCKINDEPVPEPYSKIEIEKFGNENTFEVYLVKKKDTDRTYKYFDIDLSKEDVEELIKTIEHEVTNNAQE